MEDPRKLRKFYSSKSSSYTVLIFEIEGPRTINLQLMHGYIHVHVATIDYFTCWSTVQWVVWTGPDCRRMFSGLDCHKRWRSRVLLSAHVGCRISLSLSDGAKLVAWASCVVLLVYSFKRNWNWPYCLVHMHLLRRQELLKFLLEPLVAFLWKFAPAKNSMQLYRTLPLLGAFRAYRRIFSYKRMFCYCTKYSLLSAHFTYTCWRKVCHCRQCMYSK